MVEILQQDCAFADADGFGQADAGGLVAHVGAVGKVVGAVFAREELVEEGGFVGGATRDIEISRIGRRQGAQVLRHQGERIVPFDWNVVIGGGVIHHGVRQSPLHLQIEIVPTLEFGDCVCCEKIWRAAFCGGLPGDCFGAVLTEFE